MIYQIDFFFMMGLRERNNRWEGIQVCPGKPSSPNSFLLSHIVYIEKKPVEVEVFSGESFGLW